MKPDWKFFLEDAGAAFDAADSSVLHFGNPTRERKLVTSGSIIADLSHLGLISVLGPDSGAFLQSQLTNDVRSVDAQHSQINGYCSVKGRLLALFRLWQNSETFYLQLPYELTEPTIKRLRMFVMRAKVKLEDATDVWARIGLSGPRADAQLAEIVASIPDAANEVVNAPEFTILRLPGPNPRFEFVGELSAIQKLWSRLAVHSASVGKEVWEHLDILAGLPNVFPATVEEFVPQMVNLPAVGGVSFQKGCYPGQEIVARMQYLGTLKRRMYLAHINTDAAPVAGDALYVAGESAQSIGVIVNAQAAPDGGYHALAVVAIGSADQNNVRLRSADGPQLLFKTLPYDPLLNA